jgi:predicted RNase H-like HicB family nuclease
MRYTVLLLPDLEEGGYSVTVPLLPGCITEGDSREEALAMAREAIGLFIEVMRDHGEHIPKEPVPLAIMQAAVEDARGTIRWCIDELKAEGKPVPAEPPEPEVAVVEVEDPQFVR